MSSYTDYILYTESEELFNHYKKRGSLTANRNGHYLLLIRSKHPPELVDGIEILSQGHCSLDDPFDKLEGEALIKYKLAYDTEPYEVENHDSTDENPEPLIITPSFAFGHYA